MELTPCGLCSSRQRQLVCSSCWQPERGKLVQLESLLRDNYRMNAEIEHRITDEPHHRALVERRATLELRKRLLAARQSQIRSRRDAIAQKQQFLRTPHVKDTLRALCESSKFVTSRLKKQLDPMSTSRSKCIVTAESIKQIPPDALRVQSLQELLTKTPSSRLQLALSERAFRLRQYQWIRKLRELREIKQTTSGDSIVRLKESEVGLLRVPAASQS